jgi:hypothetical protein
MVDQETEGNQEWSIARQREIKNGRSRDRGQSGLVDQETEGNQEWSIKRQRAIMNGRSRDRGQSRMVDQETEGNQEWSIKRQRQSRMVSLDRPFLIALCLLIDHS